MGTLGTNGCQVVCVSNTSRHKTKQDQVYWFRHKLYSSSNSPLSVFFLICLLHLLVDFLPWPRDYNDLTGQINQMASRVNHHFFFPKVSGSVNSYAEKTQSNHNKIIIIYQAKSTLDFRESNLYHGFPFFHGFSHGFPWFFPWFSMVFL